MRVRLIKPIPICCGSCGYYGTLKGATCGLSKESTYAMGVCGEHIIKQEYRHLVEKE